MKLEGESSSASLRTTLLHIHVSQSDWELTSNESNASVVLCYVLRYSALATIKATIGDPSISAMSSAGAEASASAGAGAQDVEMAGPEEGEVKTLGEEVEEVVVRTNEA